MGKKMRTVKPLSVLMALLLKQEFTPNEDGTWGAIGNRYIVTPHMLTECMRVPSDYLKYDPTWLEEVIAYPCVMRMINGVELVYFHSVSTGIVVSDGGSESTWSVGDSANWDMAHFKPYATVTILGDLDVKIQNLG